MFFKIVLLIAFTLLAAFSSDNVFGNGTTSLSVSPSTFDITYTPGRPLKGNTTFTPSVWHEDKPSGPFNTCVKSNRVNIQVTKLIYPYRALTDQDWYWTSNYNIGAKNADGFYNGLCIYTPDDMSLWDVKAIPFPNTILDVSEAANFCSKAENQGRVHKITKTVRASFEHIVGTDMFSTLSAGSVPKHLSSQSVTINLSCDCNPLSLSNGQTGPIYKIDNQKITYGLLTIGASQAVPPITATLISGQLPSGMEMKLASNTGNLYLEGIPTTEGDYRFSVKIKDSCPLERSDTEDLNISVRCGVLKFVTPQQLPDATLNKPYSVSIETTCSSSYENQSYELLGELPAGLSMSASGRISGTPTEEKSSYFYVSLKGTEQGNAKEIHQRFDLTVAREIQIISGKPQSQTGTPEIIGVPETCHPEDNLSVSYKGLLPQLGIKMGLFNEQEGGADPKLGWQAVSGQSGTLKFTAPAQSGRYLFRVYNINGQTIVSSKTFTVVKTLTNATTPSTEPPEALGNKVNPPVVKAPAAAERVVNLRERTPDLTCGNNLIIPGMNGYNIDTCTKRYDEAVILVDPDPDSPQNPRFEGEKTSVKYTWAGEGVSPSDLQIRRVYGSEAKKLGATVLVDRTRYSAFALIKSGRKIYFAIEIFNDGRDINFISIEPETEN